MEGSLVAYKVFTNGSVLNASEVNDNLMNQAVITFSNSTARGSAITSPTEGMITYLEDTDLYQFWNGTAWTNLISSGPAGKVLQVVTVNPTTTFTTTSTSYVDATDYAVTITPTSATSKVLVLFNYGHFVSMNSSTNAFGFSQILRGATVVASAKNYAVAGPVGNQELWSAATAMVLDSPATTSATTYKLQVGVNPGSQIQARPQASLVLMEIGA